MKKQGLTRELIALRIARELKDGMYVNLGIGLPELVSNFIPLEADIFLHSQIGIIGYGSIITDETKADIDLVNAGGRPVEMLPGGCFFSFDMAFGIIRGGHLDVAILGAYQVSEKGDLANWKRAGEAFAGFGGAVDLAFGAKQVFVAMEHTTPSGEPKLVKECTLPLTARAAVNKIFTNLAVVRVTPSGLVLEEVAPDVTLQEVQDCTEAKLIISSTLKEMEL